VTRLLQERQRGPSGQVCAAPVIPARPSSDSPGMSMSRGSALRSGKEVTGGILSSAPEPGRSIALRPARRPQGRGLSGLGNSPRWQVGLGRRGTGPSCRRPRGGHGRMFALPGVLGVSGRGRRAGRKVDRAPAGGRPVSEFLQEGPEGQFLFGREADGRPAGAMGLGQTSAEQAGN